MHLLAVPGTVDLAPAGSWFRWRAPDIGVHPDIPRVDPLVRTSGPPLITQEDGFTTRAADLHRDATLYDSGLLGLRDLNVVSLSATLLA